MIGNILLVGVLEDFVLLFDKVGILWLFVFEFLLGLLLVILLLIIVELMVEFEVFCLIFFVKVLIVLLVGLFSGDDLVIFLDIKLLYILLIVFFVNEV